MILFKPSVVIQVLTEEIVERPRELGYLMSAVVVEAVIYMLCMLDHVLCRRYGVWPIIKSTKYASISSN
jgi:hypothetical protein